jgi:hypothetical protein
MASWLGSLLTGVGGSLMGGLLDWMGLGPDKPEMPKQAGQALPDTKPPLQVPQAPPTQLNMPQMGARRAGGGPQANDILSQALTRWMGR